MFNLYLMIGFSSAMASHTLEIGFEKAFTGKTQQQKFFALLLGMALTMWIWPLLWIGIGWSMLTGIQMEDWKAFNVYLQTNKKDWNTISELRALAKEFYATKASIDEILKTLTQNVEKQKTTVSDLSDLEKEMKKLSDDMDEAWD